MGYFQRFKQLLQQTEEARKPLKHSAGHTKPPGNTSHMHKYANMCLLADASNTCTRTGAEMTIYAGHISYSK